MEATTSFGMVVSTFDRQLSDKLVTSATEAFEVAGGNPNDIIRIEVPGAFEIPYAMKRLIEVVKPAGIVALGSVIRGETTHYDVVVNEAARGCSELAREFTIPFGFGIITANTRAQAEARAGTNRCVGRMAMETALQMAKLENNLTGAIR